MSVNETEKNWRYSAFISYSKEKQGISENWPEWLKEQLENYHISHKVYEASPNKALIKNERLLKVCIDTSNFGTGRKVNIKSSDLQLHTAYSKEGDWFPVGNEVIKK